MSFTVVAVVIAVVKASISSDVTHLSVGSTSSPFPLTVTVPFSVSASVIISVNASLPDFVPGCCASTKVSFAAFNVVTALST